MKKSYVLMLLLAATPWVIAAEGEGTKARPIKPVGPEYPKAEQDAGHEGRVILDIHVLKNGKPESVRVQTSSGYPALDAAAVAAASKWKFNPATDTNGKKTESNALIPLQFKMPFDPLKQRCSQLTKEVQAVRAAKPDAKPMDIQTFAVTNGMVFLASSDKPMEVRLAMAKRMPEVYEAVIVECERSPDAIYEDVLAQKMEILKTPAPAPPSEK